MVHMNVFSQLPMLPASHLHFAKTFEYLL